jgi:capsular polysaccharide transport system permease protein
MTFADETAGTATRNLRKPDDRRRGRVRGTEPAPLPPAQPPVEMPDFGELRDVLTRRRGRRIQAGLARLLGFVALPTAAAALYFSTLATPLYSTDSAFVVRAGDSTSGPAMTGAMSQALPASGTTQDAMTLQVWLESRNALDRLEREIGFRDLFSHAGIDPLRRLAPDASAEDLHDLYARMVEVGFDPSEGLVRLTVSTPDPAASQKIAAALLDYAGEQVEAMTRQIR